VKETKNGIEIEKWVTERDGIPAKIEGTKDLLRIKFDNLEDKLIPITWFEFFQVFESNNLTFLYEDSDESRFCKFIGSESEK